MNIKIYGSMVLLLIFLLVTVLCSGLATAGSQRSIKERFDDFYNVEASTQEMVDTERAQLIAKNYELQFSGRNNTKNLNKIDDNDLKLLFYAADITSFYTFDPKFIEKMEYYFSELLRRKIAPIKYYYDIYASLVANREFSKAERFARRYPKIKFHSLPKVVDRFNGEKSEHTGLFFSEGERILARKVVPIEKGPKIIMIAHPSCHYSKNAMEAIRSNKKMKIIFNRYATILAPADREVDFSIFRVWNKSNPDMAMALAYKRHEWSMFDSWETPTFYFMKDGLVIDKIIGWPDDSKVNDLLEASKNINITE